MVTHRTNLSRYSPFGRLALLIVLGCVPAVIVGGLFNTWIEEHARGPVLVAAMLVVFGLVMLAAERWARGQSDLERIDTKRSLLIGAAQALALFPGVSRSGTTIAVGMFSGLTRGTAARFSFLLSAPVIVGAGIKELPDIRHAADEGVTALHLAAGFGVSFVVGLLTVHLLLRYVARRSLGVFAWYRFAFAAMALLILGAR